jgi:hypothetical protein
MNRALDRRIARSCRETSSAVRSREVGGVKVSDATTVSRETGAVASKTVLRPEPYASVEESVAAQNKRERRVKSDLSSTVWRVGGEWGQRWQQAMVGGGGRRWTAFIPTRVAPKRLLMMSAMPVAWNASEGGTRRK